MLLSDSKLLATSIQSSRSTATSRRRPDCRRNKPKLLIFDLDETLIHCIPCENLVYDGDKCVTKADVRLMLKSDDEDEEEEEIFVNIRPHIRKCILKLKEFYQVILFTASTKDYADTIVDYFDPYHELFETRLYRSSCLSTQDEVYIKDLRIFEDQWGMESIVIVDNSPHSFGLQLANGYPIVSFHANSRDEEFLIMQRYLMQLSKEPDVRPVLDRTFMMGCLRDPNICKLVEHTIEDVQRKVTDYELEPESKKETSRERRAVLTHLKRVIKTQQHQPKNEAFETCKGYEK